MQPLSPLSPDGAPVAFARTLTTKPESAGTAPERLQQIPSPSVADDGVSRRPLRTIRVDRLAPSADDEQPDASAA
jgi:hypothetical protein